MTSSKSALSDAGTPGTVEAVLSAVQTLAGDSRRNFHWPGLGVVASVIACVSIKDFVVCGIVVTVPPSGSAGGWLRWDRMVFVALQQQHGHWVPAWGEGTLKALVRLTTTAGGNCSKPARQASD
eukprot:CAMPEP_0181396788 /NCGR_PEP_ID=MMETSP1110-20121109/100_1 /TAXON_ID=174948 /ORGANISM="Symbiodinium sp., Strain CCMP421" /LENGTH=123 /DNA_ID=CAMNT_0023518507 /DNA_START=242 /DNA_END=613 /DNA_ORIENTATION=-